MGKRQRKEGINVDTSKTCHAFTNFSDGDESSELDSAEELRWQKMKANAMQRLNNARDLVAGADMESDVVSLWFVLYCTIFCDRRCDYGRKVRRATGDGTSR